MHLDWFLASKYFSGKRREAGFLSFVKYMAIGGITLGSASLLLALAITHGFSDVIANKLFEFGSHVKVQGFGSYPVGRVDTLLPFIKNNYPIESAAAVVQGQAIIQNSGSVEGAFVLGIEESQHFSYIAKYISSGSFSLEKNQQFDKEGILLGGAMAKRLGAKVGDKITIFAFPNTNSQTSAPRIDQFEVRGIFSTEIDEIDDVVCYIPLESSRKLFGYFPSEASFIETRINDVTKLWETDASLNDGRLFPYITENIYETYSSIYAWVALQENSIPFVISVMVVVAAFNLIGAILMMILERSKDIGVLKTLGAQKSSLIKIFVIEGLFVALWGLAFGISLAYGFFWIENTYHFIQLPSENYYMSQVPLKPHLFDLLMVSSVTVLLSLLAAYIPARVAGNIDPLKTIAFGR